MYTNLPYPHGNVTTYSSSRLSNDMTAEPTISTAILRPRNFDLVHKCPSTAI